MVSMRLVSLWGCAGVIVLLSACSSSDPSSGSNVIASTAEGSDESAYLEVAVTDESLELSATDANYWAKFSNIDVGQPSSN